MQLNKEFFRKRAGFLKSRAAIGVTGILAAAVLITAVLLAGSSGGDETAYRETEAVRGNLAVGVTGSGTVDVGTVEQTFDLDMSALQRAGTDSSKNTDNQSRTGESGGASGSVGSALGSMGGNMTGGNLEMFGQIFGMAQNNATENSDDGSELTVEEVCVTPGQQVEEGDVLYILEEESVTKLEERLESDVDKAKADLDSVNAEQTLSRQTAQYTYDTSIAYGSYAGTEYEASVRDLENEVAEKKEELEKARELLAEYEEQLKEAERDCADAKKVLENCEWSRDNTDKWDNTYYYVMYFQQAQTAGAAADSLEQQKEQLEQKTEQARKNVESYTLALAAAERNLGKGRLTAGETKELRSLAYNEAQEAYDLALAYLDGELQDQQEAYGEAKEKWSQYSSHIKDGAVCAASSGVITSVALEKGDTIHTNDTLVTLYDGENVTVTVTVDEDDMADIAKGTKANVSLTAYPEALFEAEVTEISDASADSSGNVTYEVTVALEAGLSGIFQGMTGDVTFITKESREVLYVSNRAIIREGTQSYVKVKDADGSIRKVRVRTGFSDGGNVEILEGLSEGDRVLIESSLSGE